ncbi:Methyltransferase type 11 [Methylocella silvestris BL2]|uniref:Methyltransferase type 11 n=1 Tax=Methylocella silvestris (strain DSM 15510 / CIP 108128 / LMG 27833 / NCIMB 13906 / BL2) TaxID=395965 RepID=B8ELA1_METSB|nr:class I SAM-dependent methyltransferase [Methylocella silvestris]ACK49096.1 Methyltransferase type 11 [Methylocella silvestris BL2]
MTDIAQGFRDADGGMLQELTHCLGVLNDLPLFRSYKARTWAALGVRDGDKVVDVACGTGFDVIEMAKRFPAAEIFGVDRSEGLLGAARSRAQGLGNVRFLQANADRLPLQTDAFDGARIDRALQHIEDPRASLREMVRVTRPGGRIVAAEPDWGTFVLYNGAGAASAKMSEVWLRSFRNPFVGRELGVMLDECGVTDLQCEAHALATTDLACADAVFDLPRLCRNCVEAGVLTPQQADLWRENALAVSEKGAFFAGVNILTFHGTVSA